MGKVNLEKTNKDADQNIDERFDSDDTGRVDKVMFRNQGAVRLKRPLKSDGTSDSQ